MKKEKGAIKPLLMNLIACAFLFILFFTGKVHAGNIGGKWYMTANGHPAILLITYGGNSGTYFQTGIVQKAIWKTLLFQAHL